MENKLSNEVSIKMSVIEKRLRKLEELVEKLGSRLSDDNFVAHNASKIREEFLNLDTELNNEIKWCSELLLEYAGTNSVNQNDEAIIQFLNKYSEDLTHLSVKNSKAMQSFERKFRQNKTFYSNMIREELEHSLANLRIDSLDPIKNSLSERTDLNALMERFLLINEALSKNEWWIRYRDKYTGKLSRLNSQIQKKLNQETGSGKELDFEVNISMLQNATEKDKRKVSASPVVTARLFNAICQGTFTLGENTIELSSNDKAMLGDFLKEVYEYRLENQGLLKIDLNKTGKGKAQKIVMANHENAGQTRTTSFKVSGVSGRSTSKITTKKSTEPTQNEKGE